MKLVQYLTQHESELFKLKTKVTYDIDDLTDIMIICAGQPEYLVAGAFPEYVSIVADDLDDLDNLLDQLDGLTADFDLMTVDSPPNNTIARPLIDVMRDVLLARYFGDDTE